jgi:hypothetical protein
MSTDDPYRDLREPVLAAASTRTPPTAASASRRLRRRRAQRGAAASAVVLVVVAGGIGLAGRTPEREITAAGIPADGPVAPAPGGTYPGTVPGTVLWLPDGADEPEVLDPATTTTVEPAPTSTSVPPEEPSMAFRGTYEGLGHYAFGEPDCPDLTHDLDLMMAVDDGSTWTLHADYCAATAADGSWHGEGPFTIVTPDGSTLVGTLVGNAQLPTAGVPYDLIITGGTGTYDGVEGNCLVTVTLDELGAGMQGNTGTFDCTVQR